jgi:hypothetical protein
VGVLSDVLAINLSIMEIAMENFHGNFHGDALAQDWARIVAHGFPPAFRQLRRSASRPELLVCA